MLFSGKDLRKLIIPLMFEQLLAVLVGLVDTLMVSQSGEAAVAGVALVDNINRLIIQVMAALATGGAVVCSQYIGKGRDDESRKSGAQLETVLLIFSVIMTAFSVSFTRPPQHLFCIHFCLFLLTCAYALSYNRYKGKSHRSCRNIGKINNCITY